MRPFFTGNYITSAWFFSVVYNKERYMWHWSNGIRKGQLAFLTRGFFQIVFIILVNLFYTYFRENRWEEGEDRVLDT